MSAFYILQIHRHCMNQDGEKGVNTLVGLAHCPLKCKYCLNKKILFDNNFQEVSPQELLDYVMIDYGYFVLTGGGITFGGGEPLMQYYAIKEFAKILPSDVSLCIETSLNVPSEYLESVINDIDYFIIDIKSLDENIYYQYTNKSIQKLIDNLKYIASLKLQDKCRIRVPHIPNYTTEDSIKETKRQLQEMGFSNLDEFTYITKTTIR